MAIASPVTDKEWELAPTLKTNLDIYKFMVRNMLAKEVLPARKMHQAEFIVKN